MPIYQVRINRLVVNQPITSPHHLAQLIERNLSSRLAGTPGQAPTRAGYEAQIADKVAASAFTRLRGDSGGAKRDR
jgi:hypothetical protein